MQYSTRSGGDQDFTFILRVQKESMTPHAIAQYGRWDEEAQAQQSIDPTRYEIIEVGGEPVGCSLIERAERFIQLVRLYLMPSHQGQGIGSHYISKLCAEADEAQLPIRLRVMKVNPANRLYGRFGFSTTDVTDAHYYMQRDSRFV